MFIPYVIDIKTVKWLEDAQWMTRVYEYDIFENTTYLEVVNGGQIWSPFKSPLGTIMR